MEKIKSVLQLKSAEDFEYIIEGGAFLGSGGGGPKAAGEEIKDDLVKRGIPIQLITVDELSQQLNTYGAISAFMGSPSAGAQGIDLETPTNAYNALMQLSPTKNFTYVMPIEIGAGNSLVPMTVASRLSIPVTDADGAGRAVPKIQNTTYAQSLNPCPAALSNGKTDNYPMIDNIINLKEIPSDTMSDALEAYCLKLMEIPEFGSMGGLAAFSTSAQDASKVLIPGTLSLSYYLGKSIVDALSQNVNPSVQLQNDLKRIGMSFYIFENATIMQINKPASEGDLDLGNVVLKNNQGQVMTIFYENENLFAEVDGKTWAMAPDLICYLSSKRGALSNVEIEVSDQVDIYGMPCQPQMRSYSIIQSFMSELKTLGVYDGPYIPIEALH